MKKVIVVIVCIVCVLLFTIGGPLIINWLFSIPAYYDFMRVDWETKDALAYYGSVLGFIGTVIFSGLALWQNHIIQEANNAHATLLDKMEKDKNAPHIIVKAISAWGNASKLKIHVVNITENIAEKIHAYGFAIIDETGATLWREDKVINIDYLVNGRVFEIEFENPSITNTKHKIIFDINYKDKFGDEHSCKIVGYFGEKVGLPKFKVTELK